MSASIDPWEASLDREFEKIMAMSNEELRAELIAEGKDPDVEAARIREMLERAKKRADASRRSAKVDTTQES